VWIEITATKRSKSRRNYIIRRACRPVDAGERRGSRFEGRRRIHMWGEAKGLGGRFIILPRTPAPLRGGERLVATPNLCPGRHWPQRLKKVAFRPPLFPQSHLSTLTFTFNSNHVRHCRQPRFRHHEPPLQQCFPPCWSPRRPSRHRHRSWVSNCSGFLWKTARKELELIPSLIVSGSLLVRVSVAPLPFFLPRRVPPSSSVILMRVRRTTSFAPSP